MIGRRIGIAVTLSLLALVATERGAAAQTVQPTNIVITDAKNAGDQTWGTVTSITAAGAMATQLLMPRIFYSDPEVTVGWKARWHVSVLAPVATLTMMSFANEYALKDALKSPRPDCPDDKTDTGKCHTFGGLSTHSVAAFSALGHGVGVFIFDTTKWSGGRINAGSLIGDVVAPFILGVVTGVGRGAGSWESTAQILEGGVGGLAFGFLAGMTYSLMARPECGYTGSMFCW